MHEASLRPRGLVFDPEGLVSNPEDLVADPEPQPLILNLNL